MKGSDCIRGADFEFNGKKLSSFGFIVCSFDSIKNTSDSGSNITFSHTSMFNGTRQPVSSFEYKECISDTFSICKNPCNYNGNIVAITQEEERNILKWLNVKEFKKFKPTDKYYSDVFFNGSFNGERIYNNGELVGFNLTIVTDSPFAYAEQKKFDFTTTTENQKIVIIDLSDEIGFLYPDMTITCNSSGNLSLTNEFDSRMTYIKNCKAGEVITFKNNSVIESSLTSHKIQNDFNYNFLRVCNDGEKTANQIVVSIPSKISITYNPLRKVVI